MQRGDEDKDLGPHSTSFRDRDVQSESVRKAPPEHAAPEGDGPLDRPAKKPYRTPELVVYGNVTRFPNEIDKG